MGGQQSRLKLFLRMVSLNWQGITLWTLVAGLIFFNWDWVMANQQGFLAALQIVGQILLMVFLAIMQFVAIFWFLARPRLFWIDPGETGVSFDDYKGNKGVVEVARRIVTLLRGVKNFKRMGGQVSRGLLLIGPPGTGKSYLAQCMASEAGVPFAYLSAPSVQNMFFGVSNLIVMNIYRKARKKARKYGACVVFIDEIDAIGVARGGRQGGMGGGGFMGMGGMGLLNELLMQMDPPNIEHGFLNKILRKLGLRTKRAEQPTVFTIGATNLAEVLDSALLRPGRFDWKITVDPPDFEGRKEIIDYYLAKVKHDGHMPVDRMAGDTIHYSPVQIKHVINESVVIAHFDGRQAVTYRDFQQALEVNEHGLRQPIRGLSQEEKRRIAYHEAGHAVAMYLLQPKEPPVKATIIRHGRALGFVAPKPLEEKVTMVREEVLAIIQVSLAARAAERLFLNTEMSGVVSDLMQATQAAAAYLGIYGMGGSFYSYLAFNQGQPDGELKRHIEKLLDDQFQKVSRLLQDHRDAVVAIAEGLLEREELDRDEISSLMEANRPRIGQIAAFRSHM